MQVVLNLIPRAKTDKPPTTPRPSLLPLSPPHRALSRARRAAPRRHRSQPRHLPLPHNATPRAPNGSLGIPVPVPRSLPQGNDQTSLTRRVVPAEYHWGRYPRFDGGKDSKRDDFGELIFLQHFSFRGDGVLILERGIRHTTSLMFIRTKRSIRTLRNGIQPGFWKGGKRIRTLPMGMWGGDRVVTCVWE